MLLSSVLTDSLKVLFVGHSLVGQDMPQMVESVLPPDSQVEYQIIGGSPLELNWKDHETAEGIDGRAFIADGVATVVVSRWEGELDTAKLNQVMAHPVAIGTHIADETPQPMGTDGKVAAAE